MWIVTASTDADTLTFRLLPGAVRIVGRDQGADLVVDVPLVSRVHCRLDVKSAEIEVTDLSSTNGTFVNDKRVTRASLTAGDRLRVGRLEFNVERSD